MTITVQGQRPAVLTGLNLTPIAGDYDVNEVFKDLVVRPLTAPLHAGATAVFTDDAGDVLDEDDLAGALGAAMGPNRDNDAIKIADELLEDCLINYQYSGMTNPAEVVALQAGAALKLDPPDATTIYLAQSDVIPAAKKALAGDAKGPSELLAALTYTFHTPTSAFAFITQADFEAFKTWAASQVSGLSSTLDKDTINLMSQFNTLKLDGLTESIVLRANDSENLEPFSFARLVVYLLTQYVSSNPDDECFALPMAIDEVVVPRSIVLVNVEEHARSNGARVKREWDVINESIEDGPSVLSLKQITGLTTLTRAMRKAAAGALVPASASRFMPRGRAANLAFAGNPPTKRDIGSQVLRVIRTMKKVNFSRNVLTTSRRSFSRSSRREPDDYNVPGVVRTQQYAPDIHVYADTSSSISEVDYQDAVMTIIEIAKRLNVDLYFSSFSNDVAQTVLVPTRNKTPLQIWNMISKLPKVTGGTNYANVWKYVNASRKRRKELSLMITDFEYNPPRRHVEHPANMYYVPCMNYEWSHIVSLCSRFVQNMYHIEPALAQRLIGMS